MLLVRDLFYSIGSMLAEQLECWYLLSLPTNEGDVCGYPGWREESEVSEGRIMLLYTNQKLLIPLENTRAACFPEVTMPLKENKGLAASLKCKKINKSKLLNPTVEKA